MHSIRTRAIAARIISLAAVLCLLLGVTAKGEPSLAPMLDDWLAMAQGGKAISFTLSAAVHALSPYGEETVANLDRLLGNCQVKASYQNGRDGEDVAAQILIGDIAALSFAQWQRGGQWLGQASFLPESTFSSTSGSPLDALMGSGDDIPAWIQSVPDLNASWAGIPEALAPLAPYAREQKTSYKIAGVGTAKKAVVYTIPEDKAQELGQALKLMAAKIPLPGLEELAASMTLSGNAVLTLYQSAQGENMGIALKATMGFGEAAPRKVNLVAGFSAEDEKAALSISLKAPAVSGGDNLTVTGAAKLQCGEEKNKLSFDLNIKSTLNKQTRKIAWTGDLDCLKAQDNQRLEGEAVRTLTGEDDVAYTLTLKPSLMASVADGAPSLKGSVRVQWGREKAILSDVSFSLVASEGEPPVHDQAQQVVSLDGMDEQHLASLQGQGLQNAAESIWQAVMKLPKETLALVAQCLGEVNFEELLSGNYMVSQ